MNFYFMSGLPRSGSTLLSAILSQNPSIHAEGNSAVCQLMWDMQVSCEGYAQEQLLANNRQKTQHDLISSIPIVYYKNTTKQNVVDKCRSWTLPPNMDMIKRYITKKPKVIVLTRPVDDIVKSFFKLRKKNGLKDNSSELLIKGSEPLMRSLDGVEWARKNNRGEFLFIEYDDLVDHTSDILRSIYEFCGWELYEHNLNKIKNKYPENDHVYGLLGMHDVRPTISRS